MRLRSRRSRAPTRSSAHTTKMSTAAPGAARIRRAPPRARTKQRRIAAPAHLPDLLASDLDIPARGSAHAPARRGGTKIARRLSYGTKAARPTVALGGSEGPAGVL